MISQMRNFSSKSSVKANNAREPGHVVLVNAIVCASLLLLPWLPARFQPKSICVALFTLGLKHPVTRCAGKVNIMKMLDILFWFPGDHSDHEQTVWEDVCS